MGIWSWYEGNKAEPELPHSVYRVDGDTGETTLIPDTLKGPNGLCFSPNERLLYVIESRAVPNRLIHVYDVASDGRNRVFYNAGVGTIDGMRADIDGNHWCGWGMGSDELDGVVVISPGGQAIGRIALPERCANLCFGGFHRNRLFMAASQSTYSLYVNTQGTRGG